MFLRRGCWQLCLEVPFENTGPGAHGADKVTEE